MSIIATAYAVLPDGYEHLTGIDTTVWSLTVERTDYVADRWAVRHIGSCYDIHGHAEMEPIPSSRTDEWLTAHRFPLDEALALAERVLSTLRCNGYTAAEVVEAVLGFDFEALDGAS